MKTEEQLNTKQTDAVSCLGQWLKNYCTFDWFIF